MNYIGTRNRNIIKTPSQAILSGPSEDGGLFMPESFDSLRFPIEKLMDMSDYDVAETILSNMFTDFSRDEIKEIVNSSYKNTFGNALAPLEKAGGVYFAELYHGPTCAFKDVALSVLPRLLSAAKKKCEIKDEMFILTATSGDTGGAALYGFSDVPGTKIIVFFPDGGISAVQKRQMTSCTGSNTYVCAVRGNFDDIQNGVKKTLSELAPPTGIRFSSANSINIGRLAPQITYYFTSYRDLVKKNEIKFGDTVDFVVPTGNFGDILAGYFAKKTGLFIGRLVCASNSNNILSDFFSTGVYDRRRELKKTASPSMDIIISSNLERLIYDFCGAEKTADYMNDLKNNGIFTLDGNILAEMKKTFSAGYASDEDAFSSIKTLFENDGYLVDPHTAVAYSVYKKLRDTGKKTVIISTASPYKFAGNVLSALSEEHGSDEFENLKRLEQISGIKIPCGLSGIETRSEIHKDIISHESIADYIRTKTEEIL